MFPQNNFLLGADIEIILQRIDVFTERLPSFLADTAEGAGALALEGLLYLYVARRRELVDLHTQVARRGSRLLLDVGELGLVGTDEQRHDGKSQLGVQQWV